MILHQSGGAEQAGAGPVPVSVTELGRALRQERGQQGLALESIGQEHDLKLTELQAIEAGTVSGLADRVSALRTLRRYAEVLGLPGDQYVLTAIDQWPENPDVPASVAVASSGPSNVMQVGHTQAVPVVSVDHGTGGAARGTASNRTAASPVNPFADTGVTRAVSREDDYDYLTISRIRWLRFFIVLAVLLLAVEVAALIGDHQDPKWFRQLGIDRTVPPAAIAASTPPSPKHLQKVFYQVIPGVSGHTEIDVRAPIFLVKISVIGNPCYIQATGPLQNKPFYAATLQPGQTKYFYANHVVTIEVGSAAGHIQVFKGKTVEGTFVPSVAPDTIVIKTVS